jgi:gluconolactonase
MIAGFAATGLRFPEGPVALPDGSLLVTEMAAGQLTRIGGTGNTSVVARTGGSPNGAAIGPDGRCYLCNSGGFDWVERDGRLMPGYPPAGFRGGWIEAVDLESGEIEVLYRECDGHAFRGPNDLVFDAKGGLWFTDHGKFTRRARDRGGVYYAQPDGSSVREMVSGMEGPNGIGLSPDGMTLYVAETLTARLWAFELSAPGTLAKTQRTFDGRKGRLLLGLGGYNLFDSLALDAQGNLWVATLPAGISVVSPAGELLRTLPMPESFVTNICFGGQDLRRAFVTLSSTGRVAVLDGVGPGLKLNFTNATRQKLTQP